MFNGIVAAATLKYDTMINTRLFILGLDHHFHLKTVWKCQLQNEGPDFLASLYR